MASFEDVANQFVTFYYQTFDSDRKNLAALYRDHSMLTFESSATRGAANITEKLVELPFGSVKHQVATLDAQPASDSGAVIVLVTGALQIEGQDRPMSFVQTFHLLPEGGSYFVYNDLFKLVYPAS